MSRIFVSYRRDDAQGEAGHLLADLRRRFGDDRVFMDIAAIGPGEDFGEAITKAIAGCSVVLVVIGRDWLQARDAQGRRRLDDAGDWVRLEVEAALQGSRLLVPVLVQGATMPADKSLPESIRGLARRNAHELSARRWDYDVDSLAKSVAAALGVAAQAAARDAAERGAAAAQRRTGPRWVAITVAVAGVLLGTYLLLGDRIAGSRADRATPASAAAPSPSGNAPKMATGTFGLSPAKPATGGFDRSPAYLTFARLSDDFGAQPELSEAELRRLDWTRDAACDADDRECRQAASQKVRKTLEDVCRRKVGTAPQVASQAEQLRADTALLSCVQSMQRPMLDESLQRGKDAVRAIKPG